MEPGALDLSCWPVIDHLHYESHDVLQHPEAFTFGGSNITLSPSLNMSALNELSPTFYLFRYRVFLFYEFFCRSILYGRVIFQREGMLFFFCPQSNPGLHYIRQYLQFFFWVTTHGPRSFSNGHGCLYHWCIEAGHTPTFFPIILFISIFIIPSACSILRLNSVLEIDCSIYI